MKTNSCSAGNLPPVLVLACFVATTLPLMAQPASDTLELHRTTAALSIESDPLGAIVFLDGDSVGVTPLTLSAVPPGTHTLRLVSPDLTSWLTEPLEETIELAASETMTLRYRLPSRLLVLSSPPEARVYAGDSLIGSTPVVLKDAPVQLTLRKSGYADTTLDGVSALRGIISVPLKRLWTHSEEPSIFKDSEEQTSSVRLYLTGATTVIAGAVSAYFKVKADNTYSLYARSGDPAQLAEVNRLDTAAGIALAVTQVSLGLFAYFLLSE